MSKKKNNINPCKISHESNSRAQKKKWKLFFGSEKEEMFA